MLKSNGTVLHGRALSSTIMMLLIIVGSVVSAVWGVQALMDGDSIYLATTALVSGGTLIEIFLARQIYNALGDFYSGTDAGENEYKLGF